VDNNITRVRVTRIQYSHRCVRRMIRGLEM
jgi:hypothetical protein